MAAFSKLGMEIWKPDGVKLDMYIKVPIFYSNSSNQAVVLNYNLPDENCFEELRKASGVEE